MSSTITGAPVNLVYDGRGHALVNVIVTHRPNDASNNATITVEGIDANGDKRSTPLLDDQALSNNASTDGFAVDVFQLPPDPLMAVWYVIEDAEYIDELVSVQFTAAIPVEVIPT